jgi:hypothetical protein
MFLFDQRIDTFVPPHPNLQAASCATSSPKPNIKPFMNGRTKLMAAPLTMLQNVGGEYRINGEDEVSSEDIGSGDELLGGCE